MKSSHFTTPRTLEDCQFALNADPIERYEHEGMDWQDIVVMVGCLAAAVALIIIVYME